jgi:hypothetical protein
MVNAKHSTVDYVVCVVGAAPAIPSWQVSTSAPVRAVGEADRRDVDRRPGQRVSARWGLDRRSPPHDIVLPTRLWYGDRVLAFFGTVTPAELAIEAHYPADAETTEFLRRRARAG